MKRVVTFQGRTGEVVILTDRVDFAQDLGNGTTRISVNGQIVDLLEALETVLSELDAEASEDGWDC